MSTESEQAMKAFMERTDTLKRIDARLDTIDARLDTIDARLDRLTRLS
jgi:tetrahydromethanopterin S-methyltransferase subunit G